MPHTPYSLYTWLSHAIITAGPGAHYSRQHEEDLWLGTLPEASSLFQVAHAASASERRMVPVWLRSTWLGSGSGLGLGLGLGLGIGLGGLALWG